MKIEEVKKYIRGENFAQTKSEQELMNIYEKAEKRGLNVCLITDNGHTCFDGVPTKTCLAIGPTYSSLVDPITEDLKLYN